MRVLAYYLLFLLIRPVLVSRLFRIGFAIAVDFLANATTRGRVGYGVASASRGDRDGTVKCEAEAKHRRNGIDVMPRF